MRFYVAESSATEEAGEPPRRNKVIKGRSGGVAHPLCVRMSYSFALIPLH